MCALAQVPSLFVSGARGHEGREVRNIIALPTQVIFGDVQEDRTDGNRCHDVRACLVRTPRFRWWASPNVAVCCHTTPRATLPRYLFTLCFWLDAYMSPFHASSALVEKCGNSFQCISPCSRKGCKRIQRRVARRSICEAVRGEAGTHEWTVRV
jgi:hypothetical protein